MTDFSERRIYSAFGRANLPVSQNLSAECRVQSLNTEIFRQCRSTALQKNHSLFAIRYSPFNFHQSPITIRIFPDLPICRFHDLPTTWLGRSLALPLSALQKSHPPVANCHSRSLFAIRYSPFAAVSTAGGQSRLPFATRCSPLTIRYSPLAASKGWVAKFASGCDNLLSG